ncbi:MAG TPA: ATP-binding protein [Stellaceae bacterium]
MANIDASTSIRHRALGGTFSLWQRLKLPRGFARSGEGIMFFAFCVVSALLSAVLGYVSYQSTINNFMRDKVHENQTAFELVEAFVATYSRMTADAGAGQLPLPQTFRAHAINAFNQFRSADEAMSMALVGVPGRELSTTAPDEDSAATLRELAAVTKPSMREYFIDSPAGLVLRTIYPSIASQQSCVDCHNALQPGRPAWRLRDVMGGLVLDLPMGAVFQESRRHAITMATAVFLASCFVAFQLMVLNFRRKRVEIEQRSSERLAEAVESLRDGISLYDSEGRLILTNPAQRRHRDSGDARITQSPDGRWLQIREARTASGNLVRVESDVTDLMQHEAALRRAKDEAETANRAKSEFLAMMSHELRTPLNAIIGFSDVMREGTFGPMPVRYQEYLKDINDSGNHLLQIITDILDMSKLEAGMAELNETPCDVHAIIKRCGRLIAERAERGGLTIDATLPADLPALWADEVKLRQVILNLLSNAVKFTPPGGHVAITAEDLGPDDSAGGLAIEVVDNGIGMPPESIPVALSPFRQLDNQLDRKYEGTGLGLPLAKGLVELHGGVLELKSQTGLGTTARIRLPAARRRLQEHLYPVPALAGSR